MGEGRLWQGAGEMPGGLWSRGREHCIGEQLAVSVLHTSLSL
jgi:hypothetical protein